MSLVRIESEEQFAKYNDGSPLVAGFFADFSPVSQKAEPAFMEFAKRASNLRVLHIDVGKVNGIHKQFGVTSVPAVIHFLNGELLQRIMGPQTADFYEKAFLQHSTAGRDDGGKLAMPPVTVWVSDTCPWCTRVKTYLRTRQVPFSEINISRDPSAAETLRSRSGQTGVPQLSIGGRYVVGFDKQKIDRYLGLSESGE